MTTFYFQTMGSALVSIIKICDDFTFGDSDCHMLGVNLQVFEHETIIPTRRNIGCSRPQLPEKSPASSRRRGLMARDKGKHPRTILIIRGAR